MPSSRGTQIVRSSSTGEVGYLSTIERIEPPAAKWKKKRPAAAGPGETNRRVIKPAQKMAVIKNSNKLVIVPKQGPESILTLGSPVEENDDYQSVDESYGGFLKDCSFCKMRITRTMDVFMYGYLGAFCSPECRDGQIGLDESFRPPSPQPTITSAIAKFMRACKAAESASTGPGLCTKVKRHEIPGSGSFIRD